MNSINLSTSRCINIDDILSKILTLVTNSKRPPPYEISLRTPFPTERNEAHGLKHDFSVNPFFFPKKYAREICKKHFLRKGVKTAKTETNKNCMGVVGYPFRDVLFITAPRCSIIYKLGGTQKGTRLEGRERSVSSDGFTWRQELTLGDIRAEFRNLQTMEKQGIEDVEKLPQTEVAFGGRNADIVKFASRKCRTWFQDRMEKQVQKKVTSFGEALIIVLSEILKVDQQPNSKVKGLSEYTQKVS